MYEANNMVRKQSQAEDDAASFGLDVSISGLLRQPSFLARKARKSLPPPRTVDPEGGLPELNATRAKIEMHIYKSPVRNINILNSRTNLQSHNTNKTKTPSYMKE